MKQDVKMATGWLVWALLAVGVVSAIAWGWRYYTAEVRGVANAEVSIESANSRIANYDHFFDLCASVQGYEGAIGVQKALLPNLTGKDKERTGVVIASMEAQRARAIAQYNADARKSYTKARFLASELPHQLNLSAESTTCN